MADIIRPVDLHLESVRIMKLEGLLRVAAVIGKAALLALGTQCVSIEAGNVEVKVIDGVFLISISLLDTEKGRTHAKNVDSGRLLAHGHPEELLIELGGLVQVRDTQGDVIDADGLEAGRLGRGPQCADPGKRTGRDGSNRSRKLTAAQFAAFEICQ